MIEGNFRAALYEAFREQYFEGVAHLFYLQTVQFSGPGVGHAIDKVAKQRGGLNDSNREWEVGSHGYRRFYLSTNNTM